MDIQTVATPLVTVCVPVRNGARTLGKALQSIKSQTYANLEIILSDNSSSDDTGRLMEAFASDDRRATYVRQDAAVPVLEHFSRLIEAARGKYILFCADDDTRNDTYIEALVDTLERSPNAVLAFGKVVTFNDEGDRRELAFQFENATRSRLGRVSQSAWRQCFHFYGVWRTATLRAIKLRESMYWPDMQVMMGANCYGTFVRDDRAVFHYYEAVKTNRERALLQSFKSPTLFFRARMFTTSVAAVLEAGGGVPTAMWGASNLALREARSVLIVLRRNLGPRMQRARR